jgi:drug/metabolite transporter (DMT)-like permease
LNRLKADLTLGLAGFIWGFGFVAQKDALHHIGPFTFVALRFLLSALVITPFVMREDGFKLLRHSKPSGLSRKNIVAMSAAFAIGVLLQQLGIQTTTVTNAAFLTGLYVVMVPAVGWILYRTKILPPTLIAALLSLLGVWLLAGGSITKPLQGFGFGDLLVLGCAFGFAFQVSMMGRIAKIIQIPFALSFIQYLVVGLIASLLALCLEPMDWQTIRAAWIPILYAGAISGGIAYTLQSVAQQYTSSADTAIILSSEALFGGLGGMWLLKERLDLAGWLGCAVIIIAIIVVELAPFINRPLSLKPVISKT